MRLECHVFFLILALSATATVASRKEASGLVGGWTPINVRDPHVVEIAQFAVTEYNNQPDHTSVKLVNVIKGDTQEAVSRTNYRLTLRTTFADAFITHIYEAIVWEKQKLRGLTSFKFVQA